MINVLKALRAILLISVTGFASACLGLSPHTEEESGDIRTIVEPNNRVERELPAPATVQPVPDSIVVYHAPPLDREGEISPRNNYRLLLPLPVPEEPVVSEEPVVPKEAVLLREALGIYSRMGRSMKADALLSGSASLRQPEVGSYDTITQEAYSPIGNSAQRVVFTAAEPIFKNPVTPYRGGALERLEIEREGIPFEKMADASIREEVYRLQGEEEPAKVAEGPIGGTEKISEILKSGVSEPVKGSGKSVSPAIPKKVVGKDEIRVRNGGEEQVENRAGEKQGTIDRSTAEREVQEEQREIYARPGDDIEISLDNEGWLFLGYKQPGDSSVLPFRSRDYKNGSTVFRFSALQIGSYVLPFLNQNNETGTQRKMLLSLRVLPEEEFQNLMSDGQGDRIHQGTDSKYAERLMNAGHYEAALKEFLKGYRVDEPTGNESIALIYSKMGKHGKALEYWQRNVGMPGEYSGRAVLGIVRTCVMGDDYTTLVRYVEPFMRIDQLPIDTETVTLARYVIAKGDYHTAREVLENYQSSYPSGDAMDEVLFLLGRVYEESTEFRDIAGARGAYERVFRDFPESPLSEKANERVRFLNRHFFYIR